MFRFFDIIIRIFETIFLFISHLIEMVGYVFAFITNGVFYVFECFAFLPSFVLPFVGAVVSYCVLLTIINRGKS